MASLNELEMNSEGNIDEVIHIDKQEIEDDAFYSQFSQSEYQDFTDVTSMKSCDASYDSESENDILEKNEQDFIIDNENILSNINYTNCEKINIIKSSSENSLNKISKIRYKNSQNGNINLNRDKLNILLAPRSRSSNELHDSINNNNSIKKTSNIEYDVESKNVLNSILETKKKDVLLKNENLIFSGGDFHSRLTNIQDALKRLKFDIEQEKLFWRQELNTLFKEHLRHMNKFKNNEKDNLLLNEISSFDNKSNLNSEELTIYSKSGYF